jgi:hypothetical protein
MTKNGRKKITAKKCEIFIFFLQIPIYLSLGLHKERQSTEAFSPQKRTSSNYPGAH